MVRRRMLVFQQRWILRGEGALTEMGKEVLMRVFQLLPVLSISSFSSVPAYASARRTDFDRGNRTERFLLTAADQKDGSRSDRLARVIHAKFEAGLLRPYNHVVGYTRLMRWMADK